MNGSRSQHKTLFVTIVFLGPQRLTKKICNTRFSNNNLEKIFIFLLYTKIIIFYQGKRSNMDTMLFCTTNSSCVIYLCSPTYCSLVVKALKSNANKMFYDCSPCCILCYYDCSHSCKILPTGITSSGCK